VIYITKLKVNKVVMNEIFTGGYGENMPNVQERLRFTIAEGQVDPEPRIASGEIDAKKVDELESRIIQGDFTIHGDPTEIPCDCMDCRSQANGEEVVSTKAAGGTTTIVVADALTDNSYRHPGEKAPAHKKRILTELIKAGHKVGGHRADKTARPDFSGCGAEDKLDSKDPDQPSILEYLHRRSKDIFATIRSLGSEVEPELEAEIGENAQKLRDEEYATTGKELSEAGLQVAGEGSVKTLTGPQLAVITAIMRIPGERLDQKRIRAEYGPGYEVFEIAAWSIANGARATSLSETEEHRKTAAGLAYNLAAAGVIAGPGMRIAVV
jgi:hypothetical protein